MAKKTTKASVITANEEQSEVASNISSTDASASDGQSIKVAEGSIQTKSVDPNVKAAAMAIQITAADEKDIRYYGEILRKANIMESSDPYLCYSLLGKCVQLIERNPEKFVEIYPNRKTDLKILHTRLKKLQDKYQADIDASKASLGYEEDSNQGSFTQFIEEAMERAKMLAGQFKYANALKVLDEAQSMAKDYNLQDQMQNIKNQRKIYADQQKSYQTKVDNLAKMVKNADTYTQQENWHLLINESKTIILTAMELGNTETATKYKQILDKAQEEYSKESTNLPKLIREEETLENEGKLLEAANACVPVYNCAAKIDKPDIVTKYKNKQVDLEEKHKTLQADLETRLNFYIVKVKKDIENNQYLSAIEDCDNIIAIAKEMGKQDLVEEYTKLKKELEQKFEEYKTRLNKDIDDILAKIRQAQKIGNYKDMLALMPKVLEYLSNIDDKDRFEEYSKLQNEIQTEYNKEQAQVSEYIATLVKSMDGFKAKNQLPEAIEVCQKIIDYAKNNGREETATQFSNTLKELQDRYQKEQKIVDDQIKQLATGLDQHLKNNMLSEAMESCSKIIRLAERNNRNDIADKYLAQKNAIQQQIDQQHSDVAEVIKRYETQVNQNLEKNKLLKAMEACDRLIELGSQKDMPELVEAYLFKREEIADKYAVQQQHIAEINAKIEEIKEKIDSAEKNLNFEEAINQCKNLIDLAKTEGFEDLTIQYTAYLKTLETKNANFKNKLSEVEASKFASQKEELEKQRKILEEEQHKKADLKRIQEEQEKKRIQLEEALKAKEAERLKEIEAARKKEEELKKNEQQKRVQLEEQQKKNEIVTQSLKSELEQLRMERIKWDEDRQRWAKEQADWEKERTGYLQQKTTWEKANQEKTSKAEIDSLQNELAKIKALYQMQLKFNYSIEKIPFPAPINNVLKDFDLTDSDIKCYYTVLLDGPLKLEKIAQNLEIKASEAEVSINKLVDLGLIFLYNRQSNQYVALPPYSLIGSEIKQIQNRIQELSTIPLAKIDDKENDKKKKNKGQMGEKVDTIFSALGDLNKILQVDLGPDEQNITQDLAALKNEDLLKSYQNYYDQTGKKLDEFLQSLKSNQLQDLDLLGNNPVKEEDRQQVIAQINSIGNSVDAIKEKIFRNLSKLQMGVIQKSVNMVISTILDNEVKGLIDSIKQEVLRLFKSPIGKIYNSIYSKFENELNNVLKKQIQDNIKLLETINSERSNETEKITQNIEYLSQKYSSALSRAKRKLSTITEDFNNAISSLDSSVNTEINPQYYTILDTTRKDIDNCLLLIKDLTDYSGQLLGHITKNDAQTITIEMENTINIDDRVNSIRQLIQSNSFPAATQELESLKATNQQNPNQNLSKKIETLTSELEAKKNQSVIKEKPIPSNLRVREFENKPQAKPLPKKT